MQTYILPLYWAANPLWRYKEHCSTLPASFTLVSKCKVCCSQETWIFKKCTKADDIWRVTTSVCFKNYSVALALLHYGDGAQGQAGGNATRQNQFRGSNAAGGWNNLTQSARLPSSRRRNRRRPAGPWLFSYPLPFHHPPRLPPEQTVAHLFSPRGLGVTAEEWLPPQVLQYLHDFHSCNVTLAAKQSKSLPANSAALNTARCPDPLFRDTHLASHLVLRLVVAHVGVRWALQRFSVSSLCNMKTPECWVIIFFTRFHPQLFF